MDPRTGLGVVKADYVYRNTDDTKRVRIFKRDAGWDFDVFYRFLEGGWRVESGVFAGWGNVAPTRAAALSTAEDYHGDLTADGLGKLETVTEGWPEKPDPKVTKDAAIAIERGQIWRKGSRRFVVESYHEHWASGRGSVPEGERGVTCRAIEPSGREISYRPRKSSSNTYREQGFREKFRFVLEAPSKEKSK